MPTFPAHIVTTKNITDIKQLKGKTGGVGRAGTTTEIGMRLGLARLGIDPNSDVKLVPVGATADALAALSKGVVQFAILVEPFVREAEKLGFKSLVDIGALNMPFHWNAALTRETTIRSRAPLLSKLSRALVEAIHSFKSDRASTVKSISKYTRITDADSLDRTYQAFSKILPETPPAGGRWSEKLSRFSRAHPARSGQSQCQRICRSELCARSPSVGSDQTVVWQVDDAIGSRV